MTDNVDGIPDVSILVVAYNSAAMIGKCLGSIPAACAQFTYEVLMIDNGDGSTAALVAQDYPAVRIIPSKGNIGFAAGNNILAAKARAPFLLLANPDLEMQPGAVVELMKATRRYPDAAAWGGVTLDRSGCPDIGNSVHVPSLREFASRLIGRSLARFEPGQSFDNDSSTPALSGGFVMFSRRVWEEAGGLDERYFLYCEEVDLFYRLARSGYGFWRIGTARALHDAGHGNEFAPMRLLYRAAGTMQFIRLHWSYPAEIAAFLLIWLGAVERFVAGGLFGWLKPRLRKIGEGYRIIALHPFAWRYGYHPTKGLLAGQSKTLP